MRIEVVDETALPATARTRKLQPYVDALRRLEPGKALRVTPEDGESRRVLKRQFRYAEPEVGVSVEFINEGDAFYVRKTAARATTPPTPGRRRGRPPKSMAASRAATLRPPSSHASSEGAVGSESYGGWSSV